MRAKEIENYQTKVCEIRYFRKDKTLIQSRQEFAQAIVVASKRASASSKKCKLARSTPQKPRSSRVWHEAEQKGLAFRREQGARAALHAEAAHAIERPESKPKTRSVRALYQPQPEPDYMERLSSVHPAINDPQECTKRIQTGLAAILGPERMSLGVGSASGHMGISDDPILEQYHQDKHMQTLWTSTTITRPWYANNKKHMSATKQSAMLSRSARKFS
jgi:hypothetical protein